MPALAHRPHRRVSPRKHRGYRRVVRRSSWGRLLYNYFRDYDPNVGRYIESDPIGLAGGSASTYGYALQSPLDYADPLGLFPWVKLPGSKDCNDAEKAECKARCGARRVLGCYVTLSWKLKGIRGENADPIRSEQRTVTCNCEDLDCSRPAPKEGRGKRGSGSSNNQMPYLMPPWWWEWLIPIL